MFAPLPHDRRGNPLFLSFPRCSRRLLLRRTPPPRLLARFSSTFRLPRRFLLSLPLSLSPFATSCSPRVPAPWPSHPLGSFLQYIDRLWPFWCSSSSNRGEGEGGGGVCSWRWSSVDGNLGNTARSLIEESFAGTALKKAQIGVGERGSVTGVSFDWRILLLLWIYVRTCIVYRRQSNSRAFESALILFSLFFFLIWVSLSFFRSIVLPEETLWKSFDSRVGIDW